jgi:hypothetical protein
MTRYTAERAAALAAVAVLLGGCASQPVSGPGRAGELGQILGTGDGRVPRPLEPYLTADRAEGARNLVLNAMLAGKAAMDIGAVRQAHRVLDVAYQQIETIYADNPAAAKARSNFAPEATKDFKGEPYERAMVGYYLGLADLLMGELDNARSSFRWGELQDTMSAAEQYQGDTASLRYLFGWVHHCQGRASEARDAFKLAAEVRPGLKPPAAGDNLLVILEAGPAPVKGHAGRHKEELVYAPGPGLAEDAEAEVEVGSTKLSALLAEDIHWQANTLGGRAVDRILAGKAAFKDNATSVAQGGAAVASVGLELSRVAALTNDRRLLNIGALGAFGGLLANIGGSAVAASTTPEADTRYWSNLPAALFVTTTTIGAAAVTGTRVSGRAPVALGAATGSAGIQSIPKTDCYLARLPVGAGSPAWDPADSRGWIALDELSRRPAPAPAASPGSHGTPPVKTAPVRPTF